MLGVLQNHLQTGFQGFGYDPNMSPHIAGELRKALDSGYAIVNQTGGGALRAQSLEGSMKVSTYTARPRGMTKLLQRTPAFSTVEEWTESLSWGTATGGFVRENDLPPSSTSDYVRRTLFMKYAATVREISHVMATVHPAFGDNVALETRAGILWLLEREEDTHMHGDSSLSFSGESESYDGLDNLIDPTVVIDCQNRSLTQPLVEDMSSLLFQNKAYPDSLVLSINTRRDLIKSYYPQGRVQLPMPVEGKVGMHIRQVDTGNGDIDLFPSIFLQSSPSPAAAATHPNAPQPPASVTSAVAGTDGDFGKGAPAGDNNYYAWAITFGNRFGESAPTFIANYQQVTGANKTSGVHAALTIANQGGLGNFLPEFATVYRTSVKSAGGAAPTDVSLYSRVFRAPVQSQVGAGTTALNDVNLYLPFTSVAYMGQWDPEVITVRELLPMFRLDLGVQALAYRWIVAHYLALALFSSKKWGRFINIGPLAS